MGHTAGAAPDLGALEAVDPIRKSLLVVLRGFVRLPAADDDRWSVSRK